MFDCGFFCYKCDCGCGVCCLVFEVCVYVVFGGFSGCLRILCAVIYFAYWFCL